MREALKKFADLVGNNVVEIYNEASLQFELGFFLRNSFVDQRVHFERNVADADIFRRKNDFVKKEIDIVLLSSGVNQLNCAIEVKCPGNGQYPEQMFSFCKDIRFLEQLKKAGFKQSYFFVLTRDHLFWEGPLRDGIYSYFREHAPLTGTIIKPTGKSYESISLAGSYQIEWIVTGNIRCAIVEI